MLTFRRKQNKEPALTTSAFHTRGSHFYSVGRRVADFYQSLVTGTGCLFVSVNFFYQNCFNMIAVKSNFSNNHMSKINILRCFIGLFLMGSALGLISCSSEPNGQVSFWNNQSFVGVVQVTINGNSRSITTTQTANPGCTSTGAANFSLSPGSYSYTATDGTFNWSGRVTVSSDKCLTIQLL
jgi:hypothetical protein